MKAFEFDAEVGRILPRMCVSLSREMLIEATTSCGALQSASDRFEASILLLVLSLECVRLKSEDLRIMECLA